jgi:hypothetical protein
VQACSQVEPNFEAVGLDEPLSISFCLYIHPESFRRRLHMVRATLTRTHPLEPPHRGL